MALSYLVIMVHSEIITMHTVVEPSKKPTPIWRVSSVNTAKVSNIDIDSGEDDASARV